MSTTTTAATMDSRSSSPETPETSDVPTNITIHNELPSWYRPLPMTKNTSAIGVWNGDPFQKPENEHMLQLDDIIQEHAYDDSACSGVENSSSSTHSPSNATQAELVSPDPLRTSLRRSIPESGLSIPSLSQMHSTPIVPPPAMRACKRDPTSVSRRVVYPPRESCYNLAILTPNIPKSGAKSRVETQVRVTVDLAHASTSAGEQNYDRVGSWKWLRLPPGTSTKKRTRREGKIDPAPLDTLHLAATVTCASIPHSHVVSCGSCRNREAKRVARKLAARVRPARSDSDTPEDGCERPRNIKEDTTSIIQFNCPDVLDFSTGSAVLPVRITCYCRHHREKVGFNIHFTLLDHNGRLVGTGTTPPIMITDDHKSTVKPGTVPPTPTLETQIDWSSLPPATPSTHNTSPLRHPSRNSKGQSKTRSKPYDVASRNNQPRFSRETSVTSPSSSVNSPSTRSSTRPNTRSPTPSQLPPLSSPVSATQPSVTFTTDGDSLPTFTSGEPISTSFLDSVSGTAIFSPPNGISTITTSQFPSPSNMFSPSAPSGTQHSQLLTTLVPPQPMPFLFFNPGSPPPVTSLPLPKIHRLIPSSGPTHGGIEVTVLGENFHPAIHFKCVFGDVVASSTQRWSENTLLCVLPPRSTPGVVAVWFEGLDETMNSMLPSLFTYTDESDRALMELALQVVGLKMTGKIEDAKNIALRIVGSTGTEESPNRSGSAADSVMQAASRSFHDVPPLLFLRFGERHDHEAAVMKLLSLIDVPVEDSSIPSPVAVSHTTSSGQTLLHLAAFSKFTSLIEFLLAHDIDIDARDRNGYTALHFSVLVRSKECARLLIAAGADLEIVNATGKTPQDVAPLDFFEGIISHVTLEDDLSLKDGDEDGESQLGDVESDEDATTTVIKRKHTSRSIRRRPYRPYDPHEQPESSRVPQRSQSPDKSKNVITHKLDDTSDEKQAASFVALIQRTLAQIPAAQGIIPTMAQLPLPHLPEMPAVPWAPWAALPQIPMVFPVFIPISGWPSFLSEKQGGPRDEDPSSKEGSSRPTGQSTAQELRATWEKWIAVAIATATLRSPPADEAPPMYTPRETREATTQPPVTDMIEFHEPSPQPTAPRTPSVSDRPARRVGYEVTSTPAPDADAYEHIPVKVHNPTVKKHDRMLVLFWIPILLLSLLWAFHNCIRFAIHALKTSSMKVVVRA